ncbi:helix-turn-helix domain-containing protein [Bradyrhizobium nanningense]|uniref:helix-turn-helix domain-containing protein n=1 Tax=Bradyrhizobium nanningense TaxID=1325118 RepID=UPI003D3170A0
MTDKASARQPRGLQSASRFIGLASSRVPVCAPMRTTSQTGDERHAIMTGRRCQRAAGPPCAQHRQNQKREETHEQATELRRWLGCCRHVR